MIQLQAPPELERAERTLDGGGSGDDERVPDPFQRCRAALAVAAREVGEDVELPGLRLLSSVRVNGQPAAVPPDAVLTRVRLQFRQVLGVVHAGSEPHRLGQRVVLRGRGRGVGLAVALLVGPRPVGRIGPVVQLVLELHLADEDLEVGRQLRLSGFGCHVRARSSSAVTMIPIAEKSGRCEIRANSYVREISVDNTGRATGVIYFDAQKREVQQRAKAVVLSANASESARLLLLSTSTRFPNGLANSNGIVGRYLMLGGGGGASGLFEHPLNEYKGMISAAGILDWVPSDPKRGFYGGGRLTARGHSTLRSISGWAGCSQGVRGGGRRTRRRSKKKPTTR